MGVFLNPGNSGFAEVVNKKYIDKTGLIDVMNGMIDTSDKPVCVSRPRRFGKSYAAKMLCAYYDFTCDSRELFDNLEISGKAGFEDHINNYNVINIDMESIVSDAVRDKLPLGDIPRKLSEEIRLELIEFCPEIEHKDDLNYCFIECVEKSGRKFVFVIDEWYAIIREAKDDAETQKKYLHLLRSWFKNGNFTSRVVATAYMTGILPIKKDGSQLAISDFHEYTFLNPDPFTEYTGFDEKDVRGLCEEYDMDFERMKRWYDGYEFEGFGSIYNPYSVMETIRTGEYSSHWQKTSAAENLITYINMDEDGLQADIVKLLSGENIRVNTRGFSNDFATFRSKDDVLTLLIHLGYLSYDRNAGRVKIPNEEVKLEFTDILERPKHTKLYELVQLSDKLLNDTIAGNSDEVAAAIEKVRETNYAPQYYNNEQALRYAIKFAYIVCVNRFLWIEELPGGRGLADVVFLPKRDTAYPAIIIELKWDKDEEDALGQIDEKKYSSVLEGYFGEIVKVGISYDSDKKIHGCVIEKLQR